jgi:hypothetical protein
MGSACPQALSSTRTAIRGMVLRYLKLFISLVVIQGMMVAGSILAAIQNGCKCKSEFAGVICLYHSVYAGDIIPFCEIEGVFLTCK